MAERHREEKFGVFKIIKEAEDQHRIRMTGAKFPDGGMRYTVEFDARGFENIHMSEERWPPEKVNGYYHHEEGIGPGGIDSFRVFGVSWVKMVLRGGPDYFNVYYLDKTAEEPKEEALASGVTDEYTWYVSPWANPMVKAGVGVVAVAVAGGAITKWLGWW